MTDLIGTTIDQYEIIEEIGRGGMATVYRARQRGIDRDVAIKVLPSQFTHDPTFLKRFEREAHIAAQVQHPRVLPIFGVGEVEGMPYTVMAYMSGGTLADRILGSAAEGMPLPEVARILTQVAEGLDALHARGIVHRDLKPSNILLDERGDCFISDFGIAQLQEATAHLTGTGVLGTPQYMAPEVFTEGQSSPSSDLYALGVILFEMLSGQAPFEAETPAQWMRAHIEKRPPDLAHLRPDLPPDVAGVVRAALAKDPARRYATAGELAAALRSALALPAEPVKKRAPWVWIAAGVGILALVGGGLALLSGGLGPREERATDVPVAVIPETAEPTTAPTTDVPAPILIPTSTPIPIIGGGTGWIGFNGENNLAYIVDASCVLAGGAGCDPTPRLLPAADGVTPNFGHWSPDGQYVAFIDYAAHLVIDPGSGYLSLIRAPVLIASADGERLFELGDSGIIQGGYNSVDSFIPTWSPDGLRVAFAAGGDDPLPNTQGGHSETVAYVNIWLADLTCLEAGSSECLSRLTDTGLVDSAPVWSPDGSLLSFERVGQASTSEHTDTTRLLAAPPDNGALTTVLSTYVGPSGGAVWLPDSRRVIYPQSNAFPGQGVTMFDLDTGLETRLLNLDYLPRAERLAVSPDGRYVAFRTYSPEGSTDLYILDLTCADAGPDACRDAVVRVTFDPAHDIRPAWSPDGKWLAFVRVWYYADFFSTGEWTGADLYVLDVAQALQGAGEDAVTSITTVGFVNAGIEVGYGELGGNSGWLFANDGTPATPRWQPAPGR